MRSSLKKMCKSTFELFKNTLFEKKLTKKSQIINLFNIIKHEIYAQKMKENERLGNFLETR